MGARVISVDKKGYGEALKAGINAARGKYFIMGDADDSYDFSRLDAFIQKLREGNDLVMGNRFSAKEGGGIKDNAMPLLHRYLGNPAISFIARLFFKIPVSDFYCGLRGGNVDSIKSLNLKASGMEFALEMIIRSAFANLKIVQTPTTLSPDGRDRPPHLRTWSDGWRSLCFLLSFSPRWLFFYPGIALFVLGLVMCVLLDFDLLKFGRINFSFRTSVLGCLCIVSGWQFMLFGLITRKYGMNIGSLPDTKRKIDSFLKPDTMMKITAALFVCGVAMACVAFGLWAQHSFGVLTSTGATNLVIYSFTAITMSLQLFCASFFIGILQYYEQ